MFKLPAKDDVLTEEETADMIGLSVAALRMRRREHRIGFINLGRRVLHSGRHIREFVKSRYAPATQQINNLRIAYRAIENRSYVRRRRGLVKGGACPEWADRDAIKAVYLEAAALSVSTGIPHEVDHVIPLAGRNVCGLHVAGNLRAIPAGQNRAKGSKHA